MAGFLPKSIKPNFLLVVLDDLWPYQYRQFHANTPYDGDNPQNVANDATGANLYVDTPWLDSLSANGLTFQNAYGNPVCGADRASLLTGVNTHRHGIGDIPALGSPVPSLNSVPAYTKTLLTTRLKAAGYFCGIVGKYHLIDYDSSNLGVFSLADQFAHATTVGDFDDVRTTFHNFISQPVPPSHDGDNYNFYHYVNGTVNTVQSPGNLPTDHLAADFSIKVQADDAIAQIAAAGSQPWLCYLAFNAPHNPFDQPVDLTLVNTTEYNTTSPGDSWTNYQAQLEAVDTELQRVQDSMTASEWSRTVVIFTADNGFLNSVLSGATAAPFSKDIGTTGDALLALHDSGIGLNRFKNSAYEGGTRVPMIVSGPGVLGGRSTDALFHVTDIFATLVTAAGGVVGTIDGVDQGPVLNGAQTEVRTTSFCMKYHPTGDEFDFDPVWAAPNNGRRDIAYIETISGEKWKYVESLRKSSHDMEMYQLTDSSGLPVDPWELTNQWDNVGATYVSRKNTLIASVAAELIE